MIKDDSDNDDDDDIYSLICDNRIAITTEA